MRRTIKRALLGALIGGGIALAGATVANAAETSGEDGTASGTQALIGVTAPITVGGNGISVLGDSSSADAETATPASAAVPSVTTGGTDGLASGTQGVVSVAVPVTVGGNAISVLGDSESTDASASAPAPAPAPAEPAAPATSGEDSTLGGSQVVAPVQAPITVGGNAISVLGDSQSSDAGTTGGTTGTGTGGATTTGDDGTAGGTQVLAPIQAPVTLGGNAISVLGDSQSTDAGATNGTTGAGTGTGATTNGDDGIAGGTQVVAPIGAPITVGGNAISVLGDSESSRTMAAAPTTGSAGQPVTTGNESVLGGSQIVAPIALPLTLGGNAVSVVGDSTTTAPTGPTMPTDPTDPTDPGTPGTGGPGGSTPGTTGGLTATAAGIGASPAALSVTALALTGSVPGGLWIALLALLAGAALAGTTALRRRTARA